MPPEPDLPPPPPPPPATDDGPSLSVHSLGLRVPLPAGQTLLQAAQAAGIRLPRSCRNGTCRSCMCRLLQGSVRYRVEWPGLLAEEKAQGWILPCVALADADVCIDAPGATRQERPGT